MNVIDILERLESNGSRLFKEEVLFENATNDLLKNVLKAGLDPYTTYGIKKWKMPTSKQVNDSDHKIEEFITVLLPQLADRTLTGHAAKHAVELFFGQLDNLLQKWCKRLLMKNLRIGVQAKTINKVWDSLIPSFDVQLARTLSSHHDGTQFVIEETVNYPVFVEPKLDGLRCITIKRNGIVTMFTRNGREIETLTTIKNAVEKFSQDNFVLDGECMGRDWNESASIIGSKKNIKSDKQMIYHIFDVLSFDEWSEQKCYNNFSSRTSLLDQIVGTINSRNIKTVERVLANNEKELLAFYKKCLDGEFEGVMVKDPKGYYTFDRDKVIMKLKPVMTHELIIVGYYNGRDGTRHQNSIGGVHGLASNNVITSIGSGFNDVLRAKIQADPESYIGKIIECECQPDPSTDDGLTKEGKLRFPVFCRFRNESDVDPKIINAYNTYKDQKCFT